MSPRFYPISDWLLSPSQFAFLRRVIAGILMLNGPGIVALAAGEPHPLVVGKIVVEQRQVFDETDTTIVGNVGRVANAVHIPTDEDVIRRELLFKEGDPYDQRLVDESARHLRALNFIGNISITADSLPDNTITVRVSTRDRWSLRPDMSLRQGGGVTGFGIAVREDNLLGTGKKITVGYNRLSDRRNPNGGQFAYGDPRLFGTWWNGTFQYQSSDELRQASIDLEHPFYADTVTWAARGFAGSGRIGIRQYANGELVREDYLNQENEIVWAAASFGSETKFQPAAAYVRSRSSADTFQLRPFDNIDLVVASINVLHREFYKANHLENFGRVEDVPVGYQAGVAVGRNLHLTGAGSVDYFLRVFGQESFTTGGDFFGGYQASLTSYLVGHEADEMTLSASALQNWRWAPDQTLIARIATTIGFHWAPSSQVTLGSFSGLRGYRSYQLSGQRLLVMNLEDRAFSGLKVWFLRFGGALFFDSGVVWNEGGLTGQRFHSAAGFGLRVESGKNLGSGIFRIDVAFNFDRRSIELSLSSDQFFRAFSGIDFLPPIPGAAADPRQQRDR